MDLFTIVSYEIELWNLFASSRGANATIFLATVIAVWVAARFSSVMVDKGANTVAKRAGKSSLAQAHSPCLCGTPRASAQVDLVAWAHRFIPIALTKKTRCATASDSITVMLSLQLYIFIQEFC